MGGVEKRGGGYKIPAAGGGGGLNIQPPPPPTPLKNAFLPKIRGMAGEYRISPWNLGSAVTYVNSATALVNVIWSIQLDRMASM